MGLYNVYGFSSMIRSMNCILNPNTIPFNLSKESLAYYFVLDYWIVHSKFLILFISLLMTYEINFIQVWYHKDAIFKNMDNIK